MRLRYNGPHHDGVEIPELGLVVAHGETIDVPDDVGRRLAENPDWQPDSARADKEE